MRLTVFVLAIGSLLAAAAPGHHGPTLFDWRVALGLLGLVYGSVFALVIALFRAERTRTKAFRAMRVDAGQGARGVCLP